MKNCIRLAAFLALAYMIANSLMLAMWTLFFESFSDDYYYWYYRMFQEFPKGFLWMDVVEILTQFGAYDLFMPMHKRPISGAGVMLVTLYNTAILAYPVRRLWRKRTVFNAWLLAMAGTLMPSYCNYMFEGQMEYIVYGLTLMTACYALAWIMAPPDRRF